MSRISHQERERILRAGRNLSGRDPEAQGSLAAPSGSGAVKFKIKLCCNYGRDGCGWGQWHEMTVTSEARYAALLKSLVADPTVMAFESERQKDELRHGGEKQ